MACFRAGESADGPDAIAFDAQVRPKPGIAAAVHDPTVRDEEIEHMLSVGFLDHFFAGGPLLDLARIASVPRSTIAALGPAFFTCSQINSMAR